MTEVSLGRFGDRRLEKGGVFLPHRLVAASGCGMRVRRLGGTRAGEMRLTRFLRNPRVTPAQMVASAAERLSERCDGQHILAIQDTTVVKSSGGGGLYLHACITLDADDGALLGLAGAQFLEREAGRRDKRRDLPIHAKESQRWLNGAQDAARACAGARELTLIADRESDIFAAFAWRPASAHMIVRAAAGERIHWRLLTTYPITDLRGALRVAELYRRRWAIEQLFRTMKTQGFDIEGLRIEDDVPRCNLVMAALVAAVTVQQLVHARDGAPSQGRLRPITDAFDEADIPIIEAMGATLEGNTQKQMNPHPKGSLAYASWVCARLGGWNCYYGKPGPVVMLEGWFQLQAAIYEANIAKTCNV